MAHTDGWHDDILNDTEIISGIYDPKCSENSSIHAYYAAKAGLHGVDAVIGPRCSLDSVFIGMIITEENILQVTSSTSSKLSDKGIYPYSSRLRAPSNAYGEVGMLVAMLQKFTRKRLSIIYAKKQSSEDFVTEFQKLWTSQGMKIAWSEGVIAEDDDKLDQDSLQNALNHIKENNPSRVILLVAYVNYTHQILKTASDQNFLDQSIWVGTSSWVNRQKSNGIDFKLPPYGYVGITPFRNTDEYYQDYFLRGGKVAELFNGTSPDFFAEYLIDSILAVAKAYHNTPKSQRKNASHVSRELRRLKFNGVSGPVSFTNDGDRQDPQFSIYNMQNSTWIKIGTVNSLSINFSPPCFPVQGCDFVSHDYPSHLNWVVIALASVFVVSLLFLLLLIRGAFKQAVLKKNMTEIQKKIEALQQIDNELMNLDDTVEAARIRKAQLIQERVLLQDMPSKWSDSKAVIVNVSPQDEQYWSVLKELQDNMPDAHISSLWRVQNMSLWTYYCFHKERLAMNNTPHNEKSVWHGTSNVDPAIIYHDKQDGFMMQYSQRGLWG
jgi:ABC-type branched-subunit amino acid transport system substrate-binding protein